MSDKSKICVKDGESLVRSEKIKRYARYNAVFIMLIAAFVLKRYSISIQAAYIYL